MGIAIGVVAAALLGMEDPARSGGPAWVSATIRTIEAPALEWRKSYHFRLKAVGRQGASQVWTMPEAAAISLRRTPGVEVGASPKVSSAQGAKSIVDARTTRYLVTDVTRTVFGPSGPVVHAAYAPKAEGFREGSTTEISAREVAGGLAASIAIDSTWIADVREISTSTAVRPGVTCDTVATISVPQVVAAQVSGEWTIPDGEVLIISLGTQAVAAKSGVSGPLIERLAMIELGKVQPPAPEVVAASYEEEAPRGIVAAKMAAVATIAARPTPALPSRSPLPAIGPDGKAASLPPLPDPTVSTTSLNGPPSPRPSPQTDLSRSSMRFDPAVAPARYEPVPIGRSSVRLDGAELATLKQQTIRIPFSGRLSIELKARVVPTDQPE